MTTAVFAFAERDSWLRRRNPAVKIAAHLGLTLVLTFVFDPYTPMAFIVLGLAAGRVMGGIPVRMILSALTLFWLLGASLVVSNALFANDPRGMTLLWAWGPFRATVEGAAIGLSLAERTVAVGVLSLVFAMTTDPTDLVRSLVQQLHMPPRFAYTALAAFRFLPILERERDAIELAHRLRGGRRRRGPAAWLGHQRRHVLPLFTGAIRRTDRVAVAMDARGFDSGRRRTHLRQLRVDVADLVLLGGTVTMTGLILVVAARAGVLRLWTGVLGV